MRLVNCSGESLTLIIDKVSDLNGIGTNIARAAAEQSAGSRGINEAIAGMDTMTRQNARRCSGAFAQGTCRVSRFPAATRKIRPVGGPDGTSR